jgi:tRNA-dihydrouridine synthase B
MRRRRADHRHQHGLPGEEGLQRRRRLGLLSDEPLVARILEAVVAAVDVPVTLKIRTGPSPNAGMRCASRASPKRGRALLAVHGRTRACAFAARPSSTRCRGQGRRAHPGHRQWRHRTPEEAQRVLDYTAPTAS